MRVVSLVALALAVALAGSAAAQEATPESGVVAASHVPAHLLAGTCSEPAQGLAALHDAAYGLPVTEIPASPDDLQALYVGSTAANAGMVSVTHVDQPLDHLADGDHAIDVHSGLDGEEMATRIVCGEIGGFRAGGDVVFGLMEANGSRYSGTAWLHDNGDDSTTVTLFLVSGLASQAGAGAPAATPNAIARAEPLAPLPPVVEVTGVVVEDAAFAARQLTLHEGVPTVMHVVNADDGDYRFRIEDLVATTDLPANQLTVIEFTTPSLGTFDAQLLNASGDVIDAIPIRVVSVSAT